MSAVLDEPTSAPVLTSRWSSAVALDDPAEAPSVYDRYAALFASAFPGPSEDELAALVTAGRRLASALFLVDDLVDADPGAASRLSPVRLTALMHEAYSALHRLFPATDPFWDDLHACLDRQLSAFSLEEDVELRRRRGLPVPARELEALATDKCAVAEVAAHAFGALTGRRDDAARVAASIRGYNLACAFLDDLADWRADLAAGRPSLALGAVLQRLPDGTAPSPSRIAALLYPGGEGGALLDRAAAALDAARAQTDGLELPAWQAALAGTAARISALRAQLAARSPAGAPTGDRRVDVRLPARPPAGTWARLAHDAARWLVLQAPSGWREAHHRMRFDPADGFATSGTGLVIGDVFTRALVAGALARWDDAAGGRLTGLHEVALEHLRRRARPTERGRWSYFPDLPDLPADADDLAEVVRFMSAAPGGIRAADRAAVGEALDFAFSLQRPDGGLPTWLIDPCSPDAARQRLAVESAWGAGTDVEVVANLADAARSAGPLVPERGRAAAVAFVAAAQRPDGSWPSSWYHGDTWATWVCSRAVASTAGHAGRLAVTHRLLGERQGCDGGLSSAPGEPATPAHTALALLTDAVTSAALGAAADGGLDRPAALAFLEATQQQDGSWAAEPLISMDVHRAGAGAPLVVRHGSAHLTTALVCHATTARSTP